MEKHIISVEYLISDPRVQNLNFDSSESLLDADIIIFRPSADLRYSGSESHAGKRLKSDQDSASLRSDSARWNKELAIAVEHGKTVFVILSEPEDFFIYSGDKRLQGTGRSSLTVNTVVPYDPYAPIPSSSIKQNLRKGTGSRIKTTKDLGVLAPYWQEFGPYSYYEAYLDEKVGVAALVTQTGEKMVGGLAYFKDWKGTLVILPPVDFAFMAGTRGVQSSKVAARAKKQLSRTAESVAAQFVNALVQIDKAIRAHADRTPPPEWALAKEYVLEKEASLRSELAELEGQIVGLQKLKNETESKLDAAGNLRGLLYETGTPLELAVLEALRLLAFKAENYQDSDSEFDAVFSDAEGERLLGEAEGKNDKAINIDKLDQLERNVREDFEKRDDAKYVKGVLFGNAFRLTPVNARADFFTPKCLAGAKRSGIALVRTPDLFPVARYLQQYDDPAFAKSCRRAILAASGEVVVFPDLPRGDTISKVVASRPQSGPEAVTISDVSGAKSD
ncbi:MAG: hypothetical protein WCC22_05040 [Terriglobales bacterium]